LPQKIFDRARRECAAIVRWHDAGSIWFHMTKLEATSHNNLEIVSIIGSERYKNACRRDSRLYLP
jgi:hypothetical protein